MGQPLPPPRGLLAAGQLLSLEQERQKAMLRALSAGAGGLAGINLAAVGLARGKLGVAAAQEAKLRWVPRLPMSLLLPCGLLSLLSQLLSV